jgi:hypothetical protein
MALCGFRIPLGGIGALPLSERKLSSEELFTPSIGGVHIVSAGAVIFPKGGAGKFHSGCIEAKLDWRHDDYCRPHRVYICRLRRGRPNIWKRLGQARRQQSDGVLAEAGRYLTVDALARVKE